MGNKHKDPNVDIYVEVDKNFYYTGEFVNGTVHIHAKTNLTYD